MRKNPLAYPWPILKILPILLKKSTARIYNGNFALVFALRFSAPLHLCAFALKF